MKKYYIKRRDNLQSRPYYVAKGQMSATAAKKAEKSLSGFNYMKPYETEAEYFAALDSLKADGESVQDDPRPIAQAQAVAVDSIRRIKPRAAK